MHDRGKSDRPVVPAKPPNNPVDAGAEVVEGRGLPEGNATREHVPDSVPGRACLAIWIACAGWREGAVVCGLPRFWFRPGRSPHDALDALAVGITRRRVNWVLDADIRDFFTSLDQAWLEEFLEHRIADRRVLRLIQRWLKAGVIEDGE
jgi:hypothetical protein